MMDLAYRCYAALLGHPTVMNGALNKLMDSEVSIGDSVDIGRKTKLKGDVDVGSDVSIRRDCLIEGDISINSDVSINSNCKLYGNIDVGEHTNLNGNNSVIGGEINIGKYCAIAPRARMRANDHITYKPGMQMGLYSEVGANLPPTSKGPIDIGNDVWICSDSKILSGVDVGNGAVIAANSVVVDDVDPYSVVAGNPASHKKYRFDQDTIEALQDISWWDWSDDKLKENVGFFDTDLRDVDDVRSLVK